MAKKDKRKKQSGVENLERTARAEDTEFSAETAAAQTPASQSKNQKKKK